MAIAKSGLLRGLRGKTAGLVMTQTKQGTVVREYKDTITNPRTKAQQANRSVFKAAVLTSANSLSSIGEMYGTNRMPSYSKLVSMIMRNIGGKAERSFKNGILSPVLPMFNAIGINNDDLGLNIFNLKYAEISESGNFLELGAKLTKFKGTGLSFYFGCDYAVNGFNIFAIGLNARYSFSQNIDFSRIGGVIGGQKNMGFYDSAENCGLGWNYIYSITLETSGFHGIRMPLSKKDQPDLFKNDIYEANEENRLGNYVYGTFLLACDDGEAVTTKKGGKFLSSGNFYRRLPDAGGKGEGA